MAIVSMRAIFLNKSSQDVSNILLRSKSSEITIHFVYITAHAVTYCKREHIVPDFFHYRRIFPDHFQIH